MDQILPYITFRNIVDLLLVLCMFYYAYRLLHRSGAVNLFWGLVAFVVVWALVDKVFHLTLSGAIFNQLISVAAVAIIIIFQNEIRMFFSSVGSHVGKGLSLAKLRQKEETGHLVEELRIALQHMSEERTGALIVLTRSQELSEYAETGQTIDAAVSARLIENIFFKNSPLHDGALFITDGRLRSAACILPVSSDKTLPQQYGLRHRAAVGLAEQTDAVVLVVSEETGDIAMAQGDKIRKILHSELTSTLYTLFES